jgi:hypothetical protein
MDTFSLMMIGIGIAYFMFYVFFPFIGWVFNWGPKPKRMMYRDYTKELEAKRKWLKDINIVSNENIKDSLNAYMPIDQNKND